MGLAIDREQFDPVDAGRRAAHPPSQAEAAGRIDLGRVSVDSSALRAVKGDLTGATQSIGTRPGPSCMVAGDAGGLPISVVLSPANDLPPRWVAGSRARPRVTAGRRAANLARGEQPPRAEVSRYVRSATPATPRPPTAEQASHNPCPQSASHNHRSPRVVRRSSVIYSATPVPTPDQPPLVIWFRLLPAIRSLPRIVLAMTRGHSERMTRAANGTTLAGRSLVPPRRHRPRCSLRCHRRDKRPRRRPARVVANHDGPGRLQLGAARPRSGGSGQELDVGAGHRRSAPMNHRLLWWSFCWTLLICERGCSSTEASWSWLVLRWWLGVADRAGSRRSGRSAAWTTTLTPARDATG